MIVVNLLFGMLALFHLAYLGVMFDQVNVFSTLSGFTQYSDRAMFHLGYLGVMFDQVSV